MSIDVHLYKKKTGEYIRTVRNVEPGTVIDVEGEPHEIEVRTEPSLPPTRWPNGGDPGGAEL